MLRCLGIGFRVFVMVLPLLPMLTGKAFAQQDSMPTLRGSFSRQNDFTYISSLNLAYPYQRGKYSLDLNLYHNNIYNTSLPDGRFAQLQIDVQLWQHYQLLPRLDAACFLETNQFINTETQRFNLYGGVRWRPDSSLTVTPLLGYTLDIRNGRLDPGLTPAIRGRHYKELPLGLFTETQVNARYKHILPRRQRNVSILHQWGKAFGEEARLVAGVGAGSHEMDDYASQSVKRILTDSIAPYIRWEYAFLPGLRWSSNSDFQAVRRRFSYSRLDSLDRIIDPAGLPADSSVAEFNNLQFEEIIVNTQQQLDWMLEHWQMRAGYEFQYYTRGYQLENNRLDLPLAFEQQLAQEQQKDFGKQLHRLSLDVTWQPGPRQRLVARAMNSYLRYDTPSETNFDDRDELNWFGSIEWNSRWSRKFGTKAGLSGNWRHYAFLFKERSAENYIQRFLRADFQYGWDILPLLRLEGENAVYVTYNVKDFSDGNKTDRSTRNLETNAKLIWRPIPKWEARLSGARKEIHQSYLNWEAFTETNLDTNVIYTVELINRLQFQPRGSGARLFADLGYKQFNQTKRFPSVMVAHTGDVKPISLHQVVLQTGPVVGLGLKARNQSSLEVSVWWQSHIRRFRYFEAEEITVIGTSYTEAELEEVSRKLKPFLQLTASIRFEGGDGNRPRRRG